MESLVRDKQSSLLGPLISYHEKEVFWIMSQSFINPRLRTFFRINFSFIASFSVILKGKKLPTAHAPHAVLSQHSNTRNVHGISTKLAVNMQLEAGSFSIIVKCTKLPTAHALHAVLIHNKHTQTICIDCQRIMWCTCSWDCFTS